MFRIGGDHRYRWVSRSEAVQAASGGLRTWQAIPRRL